MRVSSVVSSPFCSTLACLALLGATSLTGCAATPAVVATPKAPSSEAPKSETQRKPKPPLPADIVAQSALPIYGLSSAAADGEQQSSPTRLDEQGVWEQLRKARVVCFGEQHNDAAHHYAELRALQELAQHAADKGHVLAVGFEMFQTPYQATLSGFVDGSLNEAEFLEQSNYKKRWGYDIALYRPLLETAQKFHLPALALNAPKAITRSIGRAGLAQLDEEKKAQLPELDLNNAIHRKYFNDAMGEHPMPAGGPKMDDMYAAQVTWDETMADTSARWLDAHGENSTLIVFAGNGHCHHTAIPARITRRTQIPVLSVTPIVASKLEDNSQATTLYDLLVVLQD